VLTKNIIVA
jgi:hypothetical protein